MYNKRNVRYPYEDIMHGIRKIGFMICFIAYRFGGDLRTQSRLICRKGCEDRARACDTAYQRISLNR